MIGQHARQVEVRRPALATPHWNGVFAIVIAALALAAGVMIWLAIDAFGPVALPTHVEVLEKLSLLRVSVGGGGFI